MSSSDYESPSLSDMTDYSDPNAVGFVVVVGAILAVVNVAAAVNVAVLGVLAGGVAMFTVGAEVHYLVAAVETAVGVSDK